MSRSAPLALILGIPGTTLSADERALFRETNPLGLFLGRRNQRDPDQLRALIDDFREAVGRADAPVLTDQEGGRVSHLDSGAWPLYRAFADFGALARRDLDAACKAMRLSSQAMGTMMSGLGLTSGSTPVLDLVFDTTSAVIGARSFGQDPEIVARLGREVIDGMLECGSMPIMKHIPGHGRARLDSHKERPVVDTARDVLRDTDFAPFAALKDCPWAMVSHVVYAAYDAERPASVSPVVHDVIRNEIGHQGVLVSDCIFMEALSGSLPERVRQVLDAGYDIALHSHGTVAESAAAAAAARPLTAAATARIAAADDRLDALRVDVDGTLAAVEAIFRAHPAA
ncbi:glycoside hydrolase family 3 protein [Aurantimonas sp. MSK8Z-1]|uniref:glycoside hydrolase family 3 N-terminal domain-containing protein n=1 Tax=Mangrovibrevibacter kandeliae TaxID=2968473 RepID=UPI0021189FE4|nr:glycoside hydrolase family 3 N-terminal domain-containing protein [Aurantimonas sp. MSK8Z-1]MCW4116305.1 glycoside hydrolase family 3 protein [Aurantimonas sp. MSK8Z-1]